MSENNVSVDGYKNLIREVFLRPIRSVIVVDDEFPTLDALLDNEIAGDKIQKWEPLNIRKARDIIRTCRAPQHRWIVDIHDGSTSTSLAEEQESASHLHQSDLMILDFHLNKKDREDGSDAINILRQLASNDHFNLVVVYTGGYDAVGGDIDRVVSEIAVGLSWHDERLDFVGRGYEDFYELLQEWGDHDPGILGKLLDSVDDAVYVKVVGEEKIDWTSVSGWAGLAAFKRLIENAPKSLEKKPHMKAALRWVFHEKQRSLVGKLSDENLGKIKFGVKDAQINWIRADRVFVTVVSKRNEASTLPDKLVDALECWNPEPHRLLMSKMRAELDERGVIAENAVLENRHLQLGWMEEYFTENEDIRTWKLHNTVGRHWEGLGWVIKSNVSAFAVRLADHLLLNGKTNAVEQWYSGLSAEHVGIHLNRYINCKSAVEGIHLNTGHVLELDGISGVKEYWVCLSPACDLVPGQKKSGWIGRLGNYLPFIAVELSEVKKSAAALESAVAGNHIFVEVNGELKVFSFTPVVSVGSVDAVGVIPNPKWEQMFAADRGKFSRGMIRVARANGECGELGIHEVRGLIIAELRYEYALNLLQRLGNNLSRIGLDFINPFG